MAPLQTFYLASTLIILPLGWLKGGHAERATVAALVVAWIAGPFMQDFRLGRMLIGIMALDGMLLVVLLRLAFRYDRWWLLVATAAQCLAVLAHLVLLLDSRLTARENVGALWVFGLITLYAVGLGVGERRLAGEPPAQPRLSDRRPPTGRPARRGQAGSSAAKMPQSSP